MVSKLTAEELADRIDEDAPFVLVDTRQEDSFEGWHVRGAENVPFDPTEGFDDEHYRRVTEIANGKPIIVICGKGLTSTPFGIHLEEAGYDDVAVVEGGMEALSAVHEVVEIDDDPVVYQLQRRATGCLSYVVGSPTSGEAIVVDPTRQTEEFAVAAQEAGLTVTAVVDTHVHADHLSGGPALAEELDASYYLGADVDDREHDYDPLPDGQQIDIEGVDLEVLHTPGHTKEMVNVLVDDEYLLTADTLFVESVGRTELGFEDDAERGAELLYESLHEKVLALDEDVVVLPGHVSIDDDLRYEAASPGEPVRARIGDLREELDLLEFDREEFVERLTEDIPEKPSDYETVVAVNAGEESVDTEEDAAELDTGPNDCSA